MSCEVERWKDVPGWEGFYQASSRGHIRSVDRIITRVDGRSKSVSGRPLVPFTNPSSGYLQVSLSIYGKKKLCYVHRLVAASFLGAPGNGLEVCHCDGNKLNNTLGNLRWDTRSGNHADKLRHGTSNRGEKHGLSKLATAQALEIKRSSAAPGVLASRFGVSRATIFLIRSGKNWAWLCDSMESVYRTGAASTPSVK